MALLWTAGITSLLIGGGIFHLGAQRPPADSAGLPDDTSIILMLAGAFWITIGGLCLLEILNPHVF